MIFLWPNIFMDFTRVKFLQLLIGAVRNSTHNCDPGPTSLRRIWDDEGACLPPTNPGPLGAACHAAQATRGPGKRCSRQQLSWLMRWVYIGLYNNDPKEKSIRMFFSHETECSRDKFCAFHSVGQTYQSKRRHFFKYISPLQKGSDKPNFLVTSTWFFKAIIATHHTKMLCDAEIHKDI